MSTPLIPIFGTSDADALTGGLSLLSTSVRRRRRLHLLRRRTRSESLCDALVNLAHLTLMPCAGLHKNLPGDVLCPILCGCCVRSTCSHATFSIYSDAFAIPCIDDEVDPVQLSADSEVVASKTTAGVEYHFMPCLSVPAFSRTAVRYSVSILYRTCKLNTR